MIQATINVGGIVLNALAIEHFILRHPADSERVSEDVLTNVTVKFMFNQEKKKKEQLILEVSWTIMITAQVYCMNLPNSQGISEIK